MGSLTITTLEEGVQWQLITVVLSLPLIWLTMFGDRMVMKFYLKYTTYILILIFGGLTHLIHVVFFLRWWDTENVLIAGRVYGRLTKLFTISFEGRDLHHLNKNETGVVLANHQTMFDFYGMLYLSDKIGKWTSVAKRELFWFWPYGLVIWLCGIIFIDRKNTEKAKQQLNKSISQIKQQKVKLLMYPEGTRNKDRSTIMPFKKGAFHVAIATQVPLLPVVYSPYYFVNVKKKFFDSGKVIIKALPAIPTKGLTTKDIDMLVEKTHQLMLEEYKALTKEVLSHLPHDYPGLWTNS